MNLTGKLEILVPPFHADDLFDPTDDGECREVERLFVERKFLSDETVFEQGSAPAALWKIVTGTAVLSRCNSKCEPAIARTVHSGEILGLTETLARIPFGATLRTVSSCICQCMDHRGLAGLLSRQPRIGQRILTLLAKNYGDALMKAANADSSCDINHIRCENGGIE